jgi:hypothetical protein
MARALQTGDIAPVRMRARNPAPTVTSEMIGAAQDAFFANKEANAANSTCRAKTKELAKLMAKGGISEFTFTATTPTGSQVPVRAAIEPIPTDMIDVNILRGLVDDATFMQVIKATRGEVEAQCGSHVAIKATTTIEKPAELKIKEVK